MYRQFQHAECGKSKKKDNVTHESSHDGTNWERETRAGTNYCKDWRKDTLWNLPGSAYCTVCVVKNGVKATLKRWLTDKAAVTAKNHQVRANAITNALKLCNANRIWDRTDIWGANLPTSKKKEKLKKLTKVAEKLTRGGELHNSVLSCANYLYAKVADLNGALNSVNPDWKPYVSDVIEVSNTKEWFAHFIVMKMILEPCYELDNTSATLTECTMPFFGVSRGPASAAAAAAADTATDAVGHQHASHNLGAIIAFENTDLNAERAFLSTIDSIGGTLNEVHKFLYGRSPPDNRYWLLGRGWR